MKRSVFIAIATAIATATCALQARTVSEINKEISALENESRKLKKNPIIVLGHKQDNMTDERKKGTSLYNICAAQGKEYSKYRTKNIIAINPVYVCPLHKCLVTDGTCSGSDSSSCRNGMGGGIGGMGGMKRQQGNSSRSFGGGGGGGCKAMDTNGTKNYMNLGAEYDTSYRSWKLLRDRIPEGEAQEKRLEEIDEQIKALKAEAKEVYEQQRQERREKREHAKALAQEKEKESGNSRNKNKKKTSGR